MIQPVLHLCYNRSKLPEELEHRMNSTPIRLLLIEDNPGDVYLLKLALGEARTCRFDVDAAVSLAEAGELLRESRHDIVLLDLSLPDSQGLDTVREVHRLVPEIPIVVLTGTEDEEVALKAVQLGAQDYLPKGNFSGGILIRSLLYSIERHRFTRELEEMSKSKDRFFSIISHDLRSPFHGLAQITAHLAEHGEELSSEERRKYAVAVRDTVGRLYNLAENLLQWSGSQSGKIPFSPEPIDLHFQAHSVLSLFTETARRKDVTVINAVDRNISVTADQNMLNTILRNLVANGIKFTPAGGRVVVAAECRPEDILVRVEDSGVGIPRDRIGELFRIDSKHTSTGTAGELGTGLGLIVCREFVERNGGTIRIESDEGAGTRVLFTLPRKTAEDPEVGTNVPTEGRRN